MEPGEVRMTSRNAMAHTQLRCICATSLWGGLLVALLALTGCPDEAEVLEGQVGDTSGVTDVASEPVPATEVLATPALQLTPTEYNNTVRDLLGMPMNPNAWPQPPAIVASLLPATGEGVGLFGAAPATIAPWPRDFPEESGVEGFEGMADGQEPSPYSVEELQKAAVHFAAYALISEDFVTCDGSPPMTAEDAEGVYWSDVSAVLSASCGGCHTTEARGGVNLASVYGDNLKPSTHCEGETVGACAVIRATDGSMPPGDKAVLGAEDRDLLAAWVDAGMPEAPEGVRTWVGLSDEDKAACGLPSVTRFTERAWRRPLSASEAERLEAFWQTNTADGVSEAGLVLTIAGVLQAPAFLYRVESGEAGEGDVTALTGWEMASKLSYFLWDSMPDALLFEAARQGQLSTAEEVALQARRMLEDRRARDAVIHFHHQWLGTGDIQKIAPARRAYGPLFGLSPAPPLDSTGDEDWPTVLGPIRHSLEAEIELFVERTLFDGAGSFEALLTDNHGYMSAKTEPIYGPGTTILPGPTVTHEYAYIAASGARESELTLYPVEFDPAERAGLLTHPAFLALGAYAVHPAPVIRGKQILSRLACQDFGAPPPGAEASVPPDIEEAEGTNRERTEQATAAPECAGCHESINPPGFAFEHYDAFGQWRAEDNGLPVDASGELSLWGGEVLSFEGGVDLAHQLAESEQVKDCYTLRWVRYATGAQLEASGPGVAALQAAFQANDDVTDLLVEIVASDLFRMRRAEVSR
jgi:cytochrome c553